MRKDTEAVTSIRAAKLSSEPDATMFVQEAITAGSIKEEEISDSTAFVLDYTKHEFTTMRMELSEIYERRQETKRLEKKA
jgi:hypothetical protein